MIQYLRSTYLNYKNLYANYLAFNKGEMCALRKVIIPQLLPEPILQNSLPCYARPDMIYVGTPNQFLQYHNEIIIFPYSWEYMMIFVLAQDTEYTFLEFRKWSLGEMLNPEIFTTRIPKIYKNIEEGYSLLNRDCSELYNER